VFVLNRYRIKFSKVGKMRFIGHLDLLKLFQRIVKMAKLPISYSKGFNPHQIMSFAAPLSLGMSSISEYVDIKLDSDIDCEKIKDSINKVAVDGIEILEVKKLNENDKSGAAALEAAVYEITFDFKCEDLNKIIDDIVKCDKILIEKNTKKKNKVVNIRPDIYSIENISDNNNSKIKVMLSSGSTKNLKPELLIKYIYENLGKEFKNYKVNYKRIALLTCENEELISL